MINSVLTEKIRADVLNKGMDMVGFAPVSRWEDCPFLLSPMAILPGCKTVIVTGIHITDTWTDLGGEPEPQDLGPGGWIDQNSFLDRTAFRVAKLLEQSGYKAITMASSNIWRYREFEGIPSIFAPDLSHIHAATAAGLAEIGWSGLAITPEFGPRVRFTSIVTDAELVPTPMYDGPKLCDLCMDCVRCCPTASLRKELQKPHEVKIGGKVYKYANKNMWRCAWAEHFNLDLNSESLKTLDKIGEKEIMEEIRIHGTKGHERGVCQKVCVPPHLRGDRILYHDGNTRYSMKRINKRYPDGMPLRKMRDDIMAKAVEMGVDIVRVKPIDINTSTGKQVVSEVPGVNTVIGFAINIPKEVKNIGKENSYVIPAYEHALHREIHDILIRMSRLIEDYGYQAAMYSGNMPPRKNIANELAEMAGVGKNGELFTTVEFGPDVILGAITTNAPLDPTLDLAEALPAQALKSPSPEVLKSELEVLARKNMVSLFGVASADVFEPIVADLKANIDESKLGYDIEDDNFRVDGKARYHGKWISKINNEEVRIKGPKEHLEGAKSVIVLGMNLPAELIANSGEEETKQIGTYGYHTYQTIFELRFAAVALAKFLNKMGYRTLIHENMLGIGSKTDTPRDYLPDTRCSSIEAVAAGLGEIGRSGSLLTNEYGAHQRKIVIITDAELPANKLYSGSRICTDCGNCETKCTMKAFKNETFKIHIGDKVINYPVIGRNRCDWAKRYSLNKFEGPELIGNQTHVEAPERFEITIEELAAGCEHKDPIMKHRTCILEPCLKHCPAGTK